MRHLKLLFFLFLTYGPPRCPFGQPDLGYAAKPVSGFRDSRRLEARRTTSGVYDRTSWVPEHQGDDQGLIDGNWCHLRQHPMGGSKFVGAGRNLERHPHRYHGLYQACVLHGSSGMCICYKFIASIPPNSVAVGL